MASDPADDLYALLGIEPHADRTQLRRAWRRLALRWHPDRAGPEATPTFQRLAAAYEVLADPRARAAYDLRRGTPPAPPASTGPRRRAPGVMLSRLSGPLAGLLACGVARYLDGDNFLELTLSAGEAAQGGMATISMRVPVRCTGCEGAGCARCAGRGEADALFAAWLAVPPGVRDGAILAPTEELPGMLRPVRFRVRVRAAR